MWSGIWTPLGLKISGAVDDRGDSRPFEALLYAQVGGTRPVFRERTQTRYFLDIDWTLEEPARYELTMEQAEQVLEKAVVGDGVSTVFRGPEVIA